MSGYILCRYSINSEHLLALSCARVLLVYLGSVCFYAVGCHLSLCCFSLFVSVAVCMRFTFITVCKVVVSEVVSVCCVVYS